MKNLTRSIFLKINLIVVILLLGLGKARAQELITFVEDAGYCWYQDPRVIIKDGKLVVGGISGVDGDVKAGIFDLDKNKNLGTSTLRENFQKDDHNAPVFYPRPDGRLLTIYAEHGTTKEHFYRISSPNNWLEWGEELKYDHVYPEPQGVTYMNLHTMKDEGLLYNFFRDGSNYNPSFMTSSDEGSTWGNRTHFIADDVEGRHRPYARYLQRDENTVAVTFTDGHPRKFGNHLYYADFTGGKFYKADGTFIKNLSDGPLLTNQAEKVYEGSGKHINQPHGLSVPNSAWTAAVAKDDKNRPYIGYTLYLTNDDHRYRLANWTGKKWVDREIAYAGKCLYTRESSYTGLVAVDPGKNSTTVYISSDVDPSTGKSSGGLHEIYKGEVSNKDDTSTIKWTAITKNSKVKNIRPILVTGEGYKVLVWLKGGFNTYTDYSTNIVGHVLEKP
ncbi:MAG: BNR-4 repeat-containing protein [Cyclobacteriaceae bacterium]